MIEKQKLIAKVSKKAGISVAKATSAYECILKETPSFRKQALKTVKEVTEKAVRVAGKQTVKKVQVVKEKAVKAYVTKEKVKAVKVTKEKLAKRTITKEKIKVVEVIKEVPVEVIKEVEIIKEVEVIKEVPVEVIKEVIKEVKLEKKIPVEVIKEITLIKEVEVEKIVEKKVEVVNKKEVEKWKGMYASLKKSYEGKLKDLNKKLSAKPKVVVKEIIKEVEVIKEIPVEIIKEVEVVKSIDFNSLKKMMMNMDTVQVSKTLVGETVTAKEATIVERRELTGKNKATKVTKGAKPTKSSSSRTKSSSSKTKSSKATKAKATKVRATKKKATKKKAVKKKVMRDDLKKVEGIGPKIEGLLNAGKITTFKQLAAAKVSSIKKILDAAGPRYQMHDPATWPKQSSLAAKGDWDKLQKWQDEMKGGRK